MAGLDCLVGFRSRGFHPDCSAASPWSALPDVFRLHGPMMRLPVGDLLEPLSEQREIEDQIWLVSFLGYDLGYFDNERGRVEPGPNPFAPDTVLIM